MHKVLLHYEKPLLQKRNMESDGMYLCTFYIDVLTKFVCCFSHKKCFISC